MAVHSGVRRDFDVISDRSDHGKCKQLEEGRQIIWKCCWLFFLSCL